jgi:hypothetical protein
MDVTAFGLKTYKYDKKYGKVVEPVDIEEVKLCKQWLLRKARKRKTINTNYSSYGLKHRVEDTYGKYVSNGAFIVAAMELGYEVKPTDFDSPNGNFNISIRTIPGLHGLGVDYIRDLKDYDRKS